MVESARGPGPRFKASSEWVASWHSPEAPFLVGFCCSSHWMDFVGAYDTGWPHSLQARISWGGATSQAPGPWASPMECFPGGFGFPALKNSCCLWTADCETTQYFHTQSSTMWTGDHGDHPFGPTAGEGGGDVGGGRVGRWDGGDDGWG